MNENKKKATSEDVNDEEWNTGDNMGMGATAIAPYANWEGPKPKTATKKNKPTAKKKKAKRKQAKASQRKNRR